MKSLDRVLENVQPVQSLVRRQCCRGQLLPAPRDSVASRHRGSSGERRGTPVCRSQGSPGCSQRLFEGSAKQRCRVPECQCERERCLLQQHASNGYRGHHDQPFGTIAETGYIGLGLLYRRRSVRAPIELHVHGPAGSDAGQRLQRAVGHAFVAHAWCSRAVPCSVAAAQSPAASADTDTGPGPGPGTGRPDLNPHVNLPVHVDVDAGRRKHPQTDTEPADD